MKVERRGKPSRAGRRREVGGSALRRAAHEADSDLPPLTPVQVRSIERTMRDLDDPTRYYLLSDLGVGAKLYYDVSDGVYVMDDLSRATLFKTRQAAEGVRATLGQHIKVVRCVTRVRSGRRVVVAPKPGTKRSGPSEARSRRTRR